MTAAEQYAQADRAAQRWVTKPAHDGRPLFPPSNAAIASRTDGHIPTAPVHADFPTYKRLMDDSGVQGGGTSTSGTGPGP